MRRDHRYRRRDQHGKGRTGIVVVFGLGGIGLNVVQGARMIGANMIIGVDINPARKELGERYGMTHFVNPKEIEGDLRVIWSTDWWRC